MDSGYQFEKPRSREQLADLLKQFVQKDREKALKKLASIHPDKELCQSIDRPVMDDDFKGNETMRMMGQDYANPFFSQYHAQNIRNGQMLNFNGGYSNACGCGSMGFNGFNGFNSNGNSNCGCDCKSKNYNNADGSSSTNNLLYLLLGAGFVWLMINIDNKRQYK